MTRQEIRALAARSALSDVKEMAGEILKVFVGFKELRPQIRESLYFVRANANAKEKTKAQTPIVRRRKRRRMTDAQKKAIGKRMKLFWAQRRAEKATAAKATESRQARSGKRQGS